MRLRKLLTFFSMMVIVIAFISQRCYAIRVEKSVVNDTNGNVLYTTTRIYTDQNKVTEVKTVDLKNNALVDYVYGYDKSGNVISEKNNLTGSDREFSFDTANQLVCEKYYDGLGNLTEEIDYQYDVKGNRTKRVVSHDNSLETTSYAYNKENQITKVNGKQDYTYDKSGNLVSDGKKTNTFDDKGELIQVKQDNKIIESYQYNDEGVRIKKESDGETKIYNYSEGQLSSITDATGKHKISFTRDANGNLVSMSDDENTYWYLFDGFWNVKGLAHKDGAKVVSYEYDAFGNCIKSEGKSTNPFMFMGYQFDQKTGLYYLGARYYEPHLGRFISADGYTGDTLITSNLYKYANNNPLRYKDSNGHWNEAIDSKLPDWAQREIRSLTADWSNATTNEAKDRIHAKANSIRAYAEKQNPTTLKGISSAFTVKYGSSGDDVSSLQQSLQQALKDTGGILVVDGRFGSKTYDALCQYQDSNSLLIDGVAGINTWAELGKFYYGENYIKLNQDSAPINEDKDTEVRTETMSISVLSNHDIVFNGQNITWNYIGTNVLDFLKVAQTVAAACRSMADIEAFNATYRPTIERIQHNRSLNLNSAQLEYLFLVDAEGVRDYLYGKSEDLINDIYKRLTGKDPVYYAKTVTGWEITTRRPGTVWDSFSQVMSDAHALLVRKDGMPHDLISMVLPTTLTGLSFIGLSEIGIVAEGIITFGIRNAITMYTYGTLAKTIAFQRGLSSLTNATKIADEVITLPEGTWQKGWAERGNIIDTVRGNTLGQNFPVIDKLEGKTAISIKSLDTAATTYQEGSTLLSKLKSFVNQLRYFTGTTYKGLAVDEGVLFTSKALELVIPDVELSAQQMQAIIDVKVFAQSLRITIKIIVGR